MTGKAAQRFAGSTPNEEKTRMRSHVIKIWQQLAVMRALAGDNDGARRATRSARALRYAQQIDHERGKRCPVLGLCEDCAQ